MRPMRRFALAQTAMAAPPTTATARQLRSPGEERHSTDDLDLDLGQL
jgi:hypothetical protein